MSQNTVSKSKPGSLTRGYDSGYDSWVWFGVYYITVVYCGEKYPLVVTNETGTVPSEWPCHGRNTFSDIELAQLSMLWNMWISQLDSTDFFGWETADIRMWTDPVWSSMIQCFVIISSIQLNLLCTQTWCLHAERNHTHCTPCLVNIDFLLVPASLFGVASIFSMPRPGLRRTSWGMSSPACANSERSIHSNMCRCPCTQVGRAWWVGNPEIQDICLCMYINMYIYIYVNIYTYIYIYIYICIYIYTYIYIYIYICIYIYMCIYILYAYTYNYIWWHMYTQRYLSVAICRNVQLAMCI